MDVRAVEAILAELGKVFRLSRMYPASHPAVQHSQSELTSTLAALATLGAVELRMSPSGFSLGATHLAARSPQVQELAGLLYAQGFRSLVMHPGLTADEVVALVRSLGAAGRPGAALGVTAAVQNLPHLSLERSAGRQSRQAATMSSAAELGPVLGTRSTGEFRPDALPPEIEARRIAPMAELASAAEAPRLLGRLGELAAVLAGTREYPMLIESLRVIATAARRPEPEVAHAARTALERFPDASLGVLVKELDDPKLPAAERDKLAAVLGMLGGRAIPVVVDAFLTSTAPEHRDLLLAVVRRAGAAALPVILARRDASPRGEVARAFALLLGATGSHGAGPALAELAGHPDPDARAAVVSALARIGGSDASRVLAIGLRDSDPRVRAAAAAAIGWHGEAGLAPLLLARLEEESDADAMAAMLRALGELREPRAVSLLLEVAKGVSGVFQRHPVRVRAAALRALGAIGTPEARLTVQGYLKHPAAEIRQAAEEALR